MSKSNFEKVKEFNQTFGMISNNQLQPDVLTNNPDLVKLRLALITEEVQELQDAIKDNDFIEVRDAIADILYVVYGMADAFGINADDDFNLVHTSNMSKVCNTEEEAINTVEDYKKRFERGETPYDTPYYEYKEDIGKWIVKNKSTGKTLKSINYNPVKFE